MNKNSVKDIARWFFENNESVRSRNFDSNVKLQKLLFYAQAMHLSINEESLFEEEVEAWPNGPVVREAYAYKRYNHIESDRDYNLSDEVLQVLNVINSVFGTLTGEELIETTHNEDPWLSKKEKITKDHNPLISKDEIADYYAPLKEVYSDFKEYDFENESVESIGGNNFIYNKKDTKLSSDDYETLFSLSSQLNPETNKYIRDETFYVYKEDDGSLVVY